MVQALESVLVGALALAQASAQARVRAPELVVGRALLDHLNGHLKGVFQAFEAWVCVVFSACPLCLVF